MADTSLGRMVVGHRQAIALLERALDGDRLNHAYLFVGPARVGKAALARAFAQALNCSGEPRPCGQCRPCRLIARGVYPDFRLLQGGRSAPEGSGARASGGGERAASRSIGIEPIRELQREAALAPYEGHWKVYVVADAQFLTPEAANCLLKTLEEPPAHVLLILTADEPDALLPTIVSRCQQIRLAPVPTDELRAALRDRWQVEPARAELLARLAAGRPGWAIDILADPKPLEERATHLADLLALGRGTRNDRFAYAEKLAQEYGRDPERVVRVLDLWLGWWRDLLLTQAGCEEMVGNWDRLDDLRRRARLLSVQQIRAALRSVEATLTHLAQNVNPRLALEVLVLGLPTG